MIEIKTRLDDGIYRSQGGGETRTHFSWSTGPRNLLLALGQLREHRATMRQGYGSIGCGHSWLEVDGHLLDEVDELADQTAAAGRQLDEMRDLLGRLGVQWLSRRDRRHARHQPAVAITGIAVEAQRAAGCGWMVTLRTDDGDHVRLEGIGGRHIKPGDRVTVEARPLPAPASGRPVRRYQLVRWIE